MKNLFFALAIVSLLISCFGGTVETEMPGTPKIESFRILGDDGFGGYVERFTFYNSWSHRDWPSLEFTVYDDDIDINEITITLNNDAYPNGKRELTFQLYQQINPQLCICQIEITQNEMMSQDNIWYLRFFVTDRNGKRSKMQKSDTFSVLPY